MKSLRFLLPAALAPVLIGLWQLLCHFVSLEKRVFLPSPLDVLNALVSSRFEILGAALNTGAGAVAGFVLAVAVSIVLAFVLSLSPLIRSALLPYVMMLQLTPIVVISPILVLWAGAGFRSVTIITFLICMFPLVVNTTQGLISTDNHLVDLFRSARATKLQEFRLLRAPAALPYFFTGLRIAATLAPIGAVVGDFTAGDSAGPGLGYLTIIYSANFRYPELFATVLANAALGFLFAGTASLLARRYLAHWHDSYPR